jgi:hypothetical protein
VKITSPNIISLIEMEVAVILLLHVVKKRAIYLPSMYALDILPRMCALHIA